MIIMRIRITSSALFVAAISVVGCAGNLPGGSDDSGSGSGSGTSSGSGSGSSSSSGSCSDVPTVTFPTTCGATADCHSANPSVAVYGLDLVSPNVASRLVGVKSGEPPLAMVPAGTLLIDPANPSKSAIYTKVTSNFTYGAQMPYALLPLDIPTQMCVLRWVITTAASARAGNSFGSDAGTTATDAGVGKAANGG
jgi:hypothetical protein